MTNYDGILQELQNKRTGLFFSPDKWKFNYYSFVPVLSIVIICMHKNSVMSQFINWK